MILEKIPQNLPEVHIRAMKLINRNPLILALVVICLAGTIAISMHRSETPIREGRVVIDESFLARSQSANAEMSADPAICALAGQSEIYRESLLKSEVTIDVRRLVRDSGEVTVWRSRADGGDETDVQQFTRRRLERWELLSPRSWPDLFKHRSYWELGSIHSQANMISY